MQKLAAVYLEAALASIHLVAGAGSHAIDSAVNIAWLQEHVDHDVVQVCVGSADPLGNDEDAEVAKEGVQENHLGNKLADDGQLVPEVALVEERQDDASIHLCDTCRACHA